MIASVGEALEIEELRWHLCNCRAVSSNSKKSVNLVNSEAGYVTIHVTKSGVDCGILVTASLQRSRASNRTSYGPKNRSY